MNYYKKYLKYKNKYMKLQEQIGGAIDINIFNAIKLLLKPEEIQGNRIPPSLHEYLNGLHNTISRPEPYDIFVGILKGFEIKNMRLGSDNKPHAKLNVGFNKAQKYIEYSSDHKMVTDINNTNPREIILTHNVEHYSTYIDTIKSFAKKVYEVIGVLVNGEIPADRISLVDNFVIQMINIKNQRIANKIKEVCQTNPNSKIIINIQEGYSSLYVKIYKTLERIANKFCATKIICQNVLEVYSPLTKEQMDRMGITNENPTQEQQSQIERFIGDWSRQVPQEYNQTQHGRPYNNGCYFSFVVDNSVPRVERTGLVVEFNNLMDGINLLQSEMQIDREILTCQNLQANNSFYLPARPILLTKKVIQHGSRAISNGVSFGSLILTCDGIQLVNEGIVNCHLSPNRKSCEYLVSCLNSRNLNGLWNVFDYVCDPADRNQVKEPKICINTEIFTNLITNYIVELNRQLLPAPNAPIRIIAGDFNKNRTDIRILPTIATEVNSLPIHDYDIDYIFRLITPIGITEHTLMIYVSPIIKLIPPGPKQINIWERPDEFIDNMDKIEKTIIKLHEELNEIEYDYENEYLSNMSKGTIQQIDNFKSYGKKLQKYYSLCEELRDGDINTYYGLLRQSICK